MSTSEHLDCPGSAGKMRNMTGTALWLLASGCVLTNTYVDCHSLLIPRKRRYSDPGTSSFQPPLAGASSVPPLSNNERSVALLYAANLPPAKRAALAAPGDHTAAHKSARIMGDVEFGPFSDGLRYPTTQAMASVLAEKSRAYCDSAREDYIASGVAEKAIRDACTFAQALFDDVRHDY